MIVQIIKIWQHKLIPDGMIIFCYFRFLLISEIPLVYDPDEDNDNLEDMTILDEDIPIGME